MEDSFQIELRRALNSKCIETLLSLCDDTTKKTVVLDFKGSHDKKLIHYAAEFGSVELLKMLVDLGANVREKHRTGKNTLHIACEEGNENIVNYLLQTVRDSSFKSALTTDYDKNAFYYAAISGNCNIVQSLKYNGNLDINKIFPNKSTALFTIVTEKIYEAAKILCQCGADVNIGFQGRNLRPIHYLAQREDGANMLKLLLKYGANVNEHWGKPPNGQQPLFIALKHKCSENAKILIEKGANVSFKGRAYKTGWIDCFSLAAMNCPSLIQDFLKHGANPNVEHEGSSVLMIAFENSAKKEDLIALIKAGASKGKIGKTAIQCCESYNQLQLFIKTGISVDEIETRHGVSTLETLLRGPFTYSELLKMQKNVSKLLSFGANPNLTRAGKDSPLILALKNNLFEVAEQLIESGANVNHIGVDCNNPAHYCCKSGSTANTNSTMRAMIQRGLLLNYKHPCGNYLFNLIVEADFDNTVPILMIEKGADPNLHKDGYDSLLMKCVKQERYQVCCALLEKGADISYRNAKGLTAFDMFADLFLEWKTGNFRQAELDKPSEKLQVLNAFLVAGIDVNKSTMSEIYPLIIAVWLRCEDTVRIILKKGGDVNIMDNFYDTPLTTALEFDLQDVVNDLLNAKANVNHKGGEIRLPRIGMNGELSSVKRMKCSNVCTDFTPQHSSVFMNGNSVLTRVLKDISGLTLDRMEAYTRILLKFGANPNLEESGSDSTLMHAVRLESLKLVRALIAAGANVNHIGQMNLTALHIYFMPNHMKGCKLYETRIKAGRHLILKLLLYNKASPNSMSSFGDLPIHLALRMESVDKERYMKDILLLLNYSTEINIPDKKGNTPIILAASFCSVDVIKKMIEIGADMEYKEHEGNSALHKHMDSEIFDREVVSILLKHGSSLKTLNNLGETPFNRFMKRGNIVYKDIKFLVDDCGSDLNSNKIGCNSALMDAIERNIFFAVPYLIRHMVNLNHIGQEGQTALHVALLKGKYRFDMSIEAKLKRIRTDKQEISDIKDPSFNIRKRGCFFQEEEVFLKRRRYSINQILKRQLVEAIETASETSKTKIDDNRQANVVETVMCLLNAGADVNIITENGKSPLYLLLSKHPWKIVQKLFPLIIEKGADPNLGHYPPLEIATLLRRVSHVKSLLKHGAKVDITNRRNETALICATRMCYLEKKEKLIQTIEILLQAGASVNVKDEQGNTPLIISIRNGCFQEGDNLDTEVNKTVSLLLKNGADPNTQDNGKDSALILAVENMLPSVVRTLLKYGANVDHIGEHCGSILQRCLHTKNTPDSNFEMLSILLNHKTYGEQINVFFPQFWNYVENLTTRDELKESWGYRRNKHIGFGWNRSIPDTKKVDKKLIGKISTMVLSNSYVDPNFTKGQQNSPLIYFCKIECSDAVKQLIHYGADVTHIGEKGETDLHHIMEISDPVTAVAMLDCIYSEPANHLLKNATGHTTLNATIKSMDELFEGPHWFNRHRLTHLYKNERMKFIALRRLMVRLLEAGANTDTDKLNESLINCSYVGDFDGMKSLISHGADMNFRDKSGSSILHLCWSYGINAALSFLKWMIGKEFDIKIVDGEENSILMSILRGSYTKKNEINEQAAELVILFAQNNVQGVKNKFGNSPLHIAAKAGYARMVDALIQHDVDVCVRNNRGFTPLHECLLSSEDRNTVSEILSTLLNHALLKEDLKSLEGGKLLYFASTIPYNPNSDEDIRDKRTEITALLLKYGADPNEHSEDCIPLVEACRQTNIGLTKLLLESGAMVNVRSSEWKRENENGCQDKRFLLDKKRNVSDGNSLLHVLFSTYGDKEKKLLLTTILIESGINVNMVDKSGRSALFSAIQTIPKETDDYLEEMDETNYMNMHSSTFRSEFPSNRYYASKEIVSELLTHGADVNLQDYDGDDVVTTFCRSGSDTDIGETLIKANDLNLNTEMFYVQLALTNKLLKYRKPNWVNFLCLLMNKGASPNIFKGKVSNLIDVTAQGNHCLVEGMLKNGANINFADPSKRSALHYSCILKNPHDRDKIIRLLVKYGADLNCRSITREKPLDSIVNSMTHDIGKHGTVKYDQDCFKEEVDLSLLNLFICGGSDLCPIKKLKKDTLSLLKKCNSKWSENLIEGSMDYSYRSVLLTLLQTGLLKTAEYIIRSGWKVERERWFSNLKIAKLKMSRFEICEEYRNPDVRDATDQFQNFIDSVNTGPKTLSIVCRKEIRQQLVKASRGAEIETKINLLPIPVKIKSFLALKDFMQDTEVIKFGEIERYN